MTADKLRSELKSQADPERAQNLKRFFKTGVGEYGHGDVFIGLTVPQIRKTVSRYLGLPLNQVLNLLKSKIHEERFAALVILVAQYTKGDVELKSKIFRQYLKHAKWINNWDLVDTSTPQTVGDWCFSNKQPQILYRLAKSRDLWERRIGVLGTFTFIRNHDFQPVLRVAEMLLKDSHDLIHKAVGWMLREAYKRENDPVIDFLDAHADHMPRTMLRYAIERMPEPQRKAYLSHRQKSS